MLMIEQGSHATRMAVRAQGAGVPRITPIHDPVDKRHSDLSFNIDTGGRPSYRVLIARDRALFAPEQAGARNASNFYDSQREGLQHDDGPPCFYLVPRSVLHAMLPAPRLFYTVIAYDDRDGTTAVYAVAPEKLATEAPSVALSGDLVGSLSLMFGTSVTRLTRVGASLAFGLSDEVLGEDLDASPPAETGLAAEDDWAEDGAGEAAAYDADESAYDDELDHAAAFEGDGDDAYDDGYGAGAQSLAEDDWRQPVFEGAESAAAFDDAPDVGVDDIWGGAAGLSSSPSHAPSRSHADDGYDDGFGEPDPAAQAYEEIGEDRDPVLEGQAYGAEGDEEDGQGDGYGSAYADDVHAFDAPTREPVPEMLPDEDADGAHAAQAGQYDDDEVEVEPAPQQAQSYAQSHADSYGDDYSDDYGGDGDSGGASQAYADPAASRTVAAPPPGAARVPFDIDACKAILARIAPFESGPDGFARTIEDGEFAGRFGTGHPAHQRYHLGLTFGAFPFVQEQGTLGQLLALMRERDRATFDASFPEADQLIAVTTAADGPRAWESPDGLSARLRPVAGKPLWQEPWLARFKRAAAHPPFQGAQNELAARLYVQPVLQVAQQIGLESEQGLTLLIDRAVQMGAPAALAWVLECATPVETPALRQRALATLDCADLSAFQTKARLPVTGVLDVATHAALIAALRASPNSPTPVLGGNEVVAAMLRHAQGLPWAARMAKLRDATSATRLFQL